MENLEYGAARLLTEAEKLYSLCRCDILMWGPISQKRTITIGKFRDLAISKYALKHYLELFPNQPNFLHFCVTNLLG